MFRLESDVSSQNDLDYVYNEFSTLLNQEMTQKLKCETFKVQSGILVSHDFKRHHLNEIWHRLTSLLGVNGLVELYCIVL